MCHLIVRRRAFATFTLPQLLSLGYSFLGTALALALCSAGKVAAGYGAWSGHPRTHRMDYPGLGYVTAYLINTSTVSATKMTSVLRIFAVSLMLMSVNHQVSGASKSPLPSQGIIPNEAIAVGIAEVVFPPIFGAEDVNKYLRTMRSSSRASGPVTGRSSRVREVARP